MGQQRSGVTESQSVIAELTLVATLRVTRRSRFRRPSSPLTPSAAVFICELTLQAKLRIEWSQERYSHLILLAFFGRNHTESRSDQVSLRNANSKQLSAIQCNYLDAQIYEKHHRCRARYVRTDGSKLPRNPHGQTPSSQQRLSRQTHT